MVGGSRTNRNINTSDRNPNQCNLVRTANDLWSTSRPPLAPSNHNSEEREMVEHPEYDQQHPNQRRVPPTHYGPHWFYLLVYLLLSMFSFCGSVIHLLTLSHSLSYSVIEYVIIPLDLAISAISLIIFCMVFPFMKRKETFPNRILVHCLLCTTFMMAFAAIIFGLQHNWLMLATLIDCIALLILLCVPRLISNFKVVQNL